MVHRWHDVENEKVTAEGEIQEAAGGEKKQNCDSLQELITSCSGTQSTPAGRLGMFARKNAHGHRTMGPVRRSSWFGLCIPPFWIWKETTDAVKVQTSKFNSRPWAEISLETIFIQSLFVAFESHDKEVAASSRPVIPELFFQQGCESNYSRESALWACDD